MSWCFAAPPSFFRWSILVSCHVSDLTRPSMTPISYKISVPGKALFLSSPITHDSTILPSTPHFPVMSLTRPTSTSSNFQYIFNNALKVYQQRTKRDLLTHPLAHRFETCDSADSILAVFQEQTQELNRSQRSYTKWLNPTVNVLHAFSETLGESFGSVCFRT